MSDGNGNTPPGPNLADGVAVGDIPVAGMLIGHYNGEAVIVLRKGESYYAIGSGCTHYHGPLNEGVFDGELVRCPWHHACFRPETGEAVRAPALDPVPTYAVEQRGDQIFVTGLRDAEIATGEVKGPESVVIIGGGAAGFATAEMLRREGYEGPVTIVSEDDSAPYDRPNVSKDYLAGNAPEEWMPLRGPEWYEEQKVELLLNTAAVRIDTADRTVTLEDGRLLTYGALLLATGASPTRLNVPGVQSGHVHYVRSLTDSREIIKAAEDAKRAVVVGASFIGLEVAASLSARGIEVHVVAPEEVPMERVLGKELGRFVRSLHEEHGVQFHMGETLARIEPDSVIAENGDRLTADIVVIGIGVRPNLSLAQDAGLEIDRGVLVDEFLRTSADGVWAAGDIARWPDPHSGERIRVEHWVVAGRMGQTVARNMLGEEVPFDFVPFFWSQHYDVPVNYVGHAEEWDSVDITGSIDDRDCVVAFRKNGRTLAVASIYRDVESLQAELAMERVDEHSLAELVPMKG